MNKRDWKARRWAKRRCRRWLHKVETLVRAGLPYAQIEEVAGRLVTVAEYDRALGPAKRWFRLRHTAAL